MLMNIVKTNQISRLEIKFGFDDKTSRQYQPSKKLDYQKLGPFTIVKQINTMVFQFKLPDSM
jgi:hypothetical protein